MRSVDLVQCVTHKWMTAERKGRPGGGEEGEPMTEMEQCMQVYEDDGMVQWCEPVLVAVQQLGLDVNEVKSVEVRAVE